MLVAREAAAIVERGCVSGSKKKIEGGGEEVEFGWELK